MEITSEILILAVALIILAAVALLELRYIRNKRGVQAEDGLIQDEAYNAVATTKAVADSLRQQGRDTTEAEIVLYQAESAYQRRQYIESKELADRAKSALRRAPQKELVSCPVPEPPVAETEEAVPEEDMAEKAAPTEVPAVAAKNLPPNYLESKFIIESTHCQMESAPEERKVLAALLLTEARECFDNADYTNALRHAMKAKRALEGGIEATPAERGPAVTEEAPPVPAAPIDACPKCGAAMAEGDQYCFACGNGRTKVCPGCSIEVKAGDQFCRKCGTAL